MADTTPIHEVRRVIIEYEIRVPAGGAARMAPEPATRPEVTPEMVDAIRRELIRSGSRNSDIFGGRA